LITSIVTRDHVRVGDLAAGTLLVYEDRDALVVKHLGRSPTSDLICELLDRWDTLDKGVRARLARSLIARVNGTAPDEATDENSLRAQLERLA
jgi:hypothetical protein